jgi:hypothetical protein
VKERDVVLSGEVKEFLLELDWQACADLASAIIYALSDGQPHDESAIAVQATEIGGFLVHYRRLSKAEAKRLSLKPDQILIIRIAPILAGTFS